MLTFVRGLILVVSALTIAGGLWIALQEGAAFWGLVTALIGVGGFVIVGLERMRYRADVEEAERPRNGSPGGVPSDAWLEPRFRPTSEVFLDPTTGRRMRVYADPATGERRYRAEGGAVRA